MTKYMKEMPFIQMLFWLAFLCALGFTVPDEAYVWQTTQAQDIRGLIFGYGFAIILEGIIFFLTLTTFRLKKEGKSLWQRVPYYIVVTGLSILSCYFLAIYTHHFYRPQLLDGAQDVPFYQYLPYIGACFPGFTILFAIMSETLGSALKKDELDLDKIKVTNQKRIDEAKERKRLKDELAKYETNPLADAAKTLRGGYDEVRKQFGRASGTQKQGKNNGKSVPPSVPPVLAPVPASSEDGTPEQERREEIVSEETQPQMVAVSGKQMAVTNKIKTDQLIKIGNTPYWTYERYVRELGTLHPELKVTRRKLETLVEEKRLTASFYHVVMQGQQKVMTLKASSAGQNKIIEELRKSHLKIVTRSNTLEQVQ